MQVMSEGKQRLPSWLLGLIVAIVIVAVALIVLNVLGYGDDPSLGTG
jgi:hypothetical protein